MGDELKTSVVGHAVSPEEAGRLIVAQTLPLDLPDTDEVSAARRHAGRPKGAKNKRSKQLRDYLLANYAHPLEVLAQTISKHVAVLAAELGCDRIDAFKIQLVAAKELAPYIEQKLPIGVQIEERVHALLIQFGEVAEDLSDEDAEEAIGALLGDTEVVG